MKLEQRARELFRRSFGTDPAVVRSAPGRVNLIGEHVDYHGGHVLPMAIGLRTAVALGPGGGRLRAVSESEQAIEELWPPKRGGGEWSDYVAGVAVLSEIPLPDGMAVAVASDLPTGAGLSSSAALEVATAFALAEWTARATSPGALAELAWSSETEFVGMPCGRMDQLASALSPDGSALLIDCRTLEMQPVPVGADLVLAESGETHALRSSGYGRRRFEGTVALEMLRREIPSLEWLVDIPPARLPALARSLPDPLDRRVRHVVNENQRAVLAARALERGDLATFGQLVNQSHDSLRDLYECSTPRLDAIVTAARALPGVLGARMMGAGWGGSVLVAAEPGRGADVAQRLTSDTVLALPAVRQVVPSPGAAFS